ncbi:hypothetical protein [Methylomonas sp. MgM2]
MAENREPRPIGFRKHSAVNGIPSHDTFGTVFAAIDHTQFSERFSRRLADLAKLNGDEIIAIDGAANNDIAWPRTGDRKQLCTGCRLSTRIAIGHGPVNLAVMPDIALNLIKNHTQRKVGIKVRRKRIARNIDYLLRLIPGI